MRHQAGRIAALVRIKNSRNGNPRWEVIITADGWQSVHNTASDASFNYEIGNPGFRVGDKVDVFINGRGTISGMARIVPPPVEHYDPRDLAIAGGDPSL